MRLGTRATLMLPLAAATWPVGRWYLLRMTDGSDEPWGLLALATLALLLWREPASEPPRLAGPAAWLALYTITYPFTPPLGRALLAAGGLGALLLRGPSAAPRWGLLALSLPVVATLQFYLGYPLRVFAATISAASLQAIGFAVSREGSLLHWAGETVLVDAPCSGIHMLWFGMYVACLLAAWHRLRAAGTFLYVTSAMAIVVAANTARTTILFFKEAHLVAWPEWTHAGVGVVLFVLAVCALAHAAPLFQARVRA